ncbi:MULTISPECIES: hypothetical protein [Rhodococcus]|uniref:hypothetical protein n=1 Tax=Rhodococcus TaxID=1827 RepID=UPI0004C32ABF|nr:MULTISPECIES: hypothetical protein [Rhodococcus]MCJ0901526.1 hypothetical protein [Rhodococcus sp. ARC_M13]UKO83689.1 hypothetical protein ITJ47_01060 [Rhodococcus erythropolis]BBE49186.1 hypothetical protein RE2895_61170 [Rhodococcus erythropolis]
MTTTGDTAHQHGYEFPTPAAEPATGFDADNLTAADELAIDIGRVAIGAGEGVPYGSEPDEFFLAAGKAVFYWLQLNGHRRIATEEADEIRQVSNCALQYGNIASREAARRLHARFLATEPAEARLDTSTAAAENIGASDGSIPSTLTAEETKAEAVTLCPNCFGRNGSHNRIHERYPAGGGGTNKPCPNAPSVKAETTPTHCRCITPDWYHDGLDAEFDGRLCRQCRLRQNIPYRDLIDSPKAPATIDASVIGVAAAALRNAMNVLDPHEGGDWEDAWHTIADLEDCAIRAETIARHENSR